MIAMTNHDEPPKNEVQKKINSPFDLSSNDNLGNIITQVKLRGDENYTEWAQFIRTLFQAQRKWILWIRPSHNQRKGPRGLVDSSIDVGIMDSEHDRL